MRELNSLPSSVVKIHPDTGIGRLAGLGKNIGNTIVEIAMRIAGMTQMKLPVGVKITVFAAGRLPIPGDSKQTYDGNAEESAKKQHS
jgi:hypothetical protein